ncbi:MAG: 16S rRNA (cytidine(1402)-2'-O)-methyltransferase [Pseudomonadota bacterium]|nr:16S rRNA (cytidine(1402)-2'-O)-methyltransferase [Pseudomonadota bacterium]
MIHSQNIVRAESNDKTTGGQLPQGLYLVATPIGNLGDLTARARDVLSRADMIACEDTRVTRKLLMLCDIPTRKLVAYHEHNAESQRPAILKAIQGGAAVAVVSDAGMPAIADPGFKLVRAAVSADLPVTCAPGANAALTALVLSGLPTDRFLFAGFLPVKTGAKDKVIRSVAGLDATLIFYESPRRLAVTLDALHEVLGPRPAAVARELTKLYEEVIRDNLDALAARCKKNGPPKGEVVIVVGPPADEAPDLSGEEIDTRLRALVAEHGTSAGARIFAAETGLKRADLYKRALALAKRGKS